MSQFVQVFSSDSVRKSGMHFLEALDNHPVHANALPEVRSETEELVRNLLVEFPDFSFTVEVDILGRHRVTIHFKGASIGIDAIA